MSKSNGSLATANSGTSLAAADKQSGKGSTKQIMQVPYRGKDRQSTNDDFSSYVVCIQAARRRQRGSMLSMSNGSLATADSGTSLAAAEKQTGEGGSKQTKPKGNWLKSRLFNKSGNNLKGMEGDDSDATSRASSSGSLHADLQWVDVSS